MAGVGEPVHVPRRPPRVRLGGYPLDRALLPETPQGGIENVVVDRPPAQDPLDALLDLITVLRLVGEHPQHQYVEVHGVRLIYVRLTYNLGRRPEAGPPVHGLLITRARRACYACPAGLLRVPGGLVTRARRACYACPAGLLRVPGGLVTRARREGISS